MYRHRIALAAAVIALPFALTACSSGGKSGPAAAAGALGQQQKNVQAGSAPATGLIPKGAAGSSAFCQSLVKASEDSAKLSSGDPGDVTLQSAQKDVEDALSNAPAAIKGDLQTIADAGRAAIAKGDTGSTDGSDATETADPAVEKATNNIASWAAMNCHFQDTQQP